MFDLYTKADHTIGRKSSSFSNNNNQLCTTLGLILYSTKNQVVTFAFFQSNVHKNKTMFYINL